jgi:hypothetical protein
VPDTECVSPSRARQLGSESWAVSFQTRPNSNRVRSIDTRLKADQTAARPNPSREAKHLGDSKRQQGLCVVFHAVLQYTQDLKNVIVCALDAACANATDENRIGCVRRSFGNCKRLPRPLFQRNFGQTAMGTRFGKRRCSEESATNVRLIARTTA